MENATTIIISSIPAMSQVSNVVVQPFSLYLGMAIAGIFSGLGSAIGSYVANKHIIENLKELKNRIKPKQNILIEPSS